MWTPALCAFAELTAECDVFAIQPCLDLEDMVEAVTERLGETVYTARVGLRGAARLLGHDRTLLLVSEFIDAGAVSKDLVARVCAERCAALNPKAVIPFKFMTVEDKTALTGPFPRCVVPAEEWYGWAFKRNE